MAIKIEMPKLSDTMEEGVISKWNVKEGDAVAAGDIIAEVDTDKATMDVEVFDGGTILKIMVAEGESVPLGGIMAVIGEPGEDISALLDGAEASAPAIEEKKEEAVVAEVVEEAPATPAVESAGSDNGRIKASPLAKKIAEG